MECQCKQESQEQEPEYLTAEALAEMLSVSKKSIDHWTQKRLIPVVKVGRLNRYPIREIHKRIASGRLLKSA